MSAETNAETPVPLEFGRGPTVLEVFLEPTCPFSQRAFEKLFALLQAAGEDRLTLKLRFVSQPWHLFSGIVTRTILAASATPGGAQTALAAMRGIYERRADFEFEDHCSGQNMHRTPTDIVADISKIAGIDLSAPFRSPAVGAALRWHTRYARQNGIHFSPTFSVNGIVNSGMSSGQSIEEWRKELGV